MAVTWTLSFSQSRCYHSTFSLYRLSATRNPATRLFPDQATPTLLVADLPGAYSYTLNDNDPLPEIGARAKRRSMLTEDAIEVPVLSGTDSQGNPIDIKADDFLIDTTAGDDNLGTVHRVMGAPRKLTSQGSFHTNCWLVQIFEEEHAPAGGALMPLNVDPLITALITQLELAVPALTTTFEAEYLSTVAWETLTLPVGVVLIEGFERAPDYGIANLNFEVLVDLWVVKELTGASAGLRRDLQAIIAQFWPADPLQAAGVGERLDIEDWSYADSLPGNEILRAANRAQRGGYVRLLCLVQFQE